MNMRINVAAIAALTLLAGCERVTVFGRTMKDDSAPAARASAKSRVAPSASALVQPGQPITRFAVEFTPAAQKQVDDDVRFNPETLREAIVAELGAQQLLNLQPGPGRSAVLQIDEFSVRATSNVVIMGHIASAGALAGTIRIRDAGSSDAKELHTRAEIPMNISRSGSDKNPLKKLYAGFARQLADDLTGTPPPVPHRP